MADSRISDLTAAGSALGADQMEVNEAGTSKRVTIDQLRDYIRTPVIPTVISVGAEFHSTGVPTATLPGTHAAGDILVLVIQLSNDSNYAAPTGYKEIGPQNGIGAAAAAGSTKIAIFWKRDGGSETAPTLTDAGDHTYGVMFAVRGCATTGDPFHFGANEWKLATSTAGSSARSVTWLDNSLVVDIFAHGIDSATAQASSVANADLTNVTEQFDGSTTDGTGGGIVIVSGENAVASRVAVTTLTWAATTVEVSTRIHFVPAVNTNRDVISGRPVEVQFFIGSAADLDAAWARPNGAARVHAQVIDGGGGGSGGNITTTAAGGGGGGGGGYDEAWYDADELGASVTIHAGKGGAAGTILNQAGNPGVLSEFDKGGQGPLTSARRIAGTGATAAASADGGNGGCGSGRGTASPAVATTRIDLTAATAGAALGGVGGRGGSGTTAPTGGSPADWGGGGGESGADTDASITGANNGWSVRGGGGGGGGRTTTNVGGGAPGGGAAAPAATQGTNGVTSTRLPYGGSGGCGGGSSVVVGGNGGFPGGGGGGGAGVTGGFGGAGAHGMVVVTTFF